VRRLSDPTRPYALVVFGAPEASTGIAAVDLASGQVQEWAALPGREPHVVVDEDEARRLAGLGPGAQAELVWAPSVRTRSPLYPLWEVSGSGGRRWVDIVAGQVTAGPPGPAGPGG
jgi:hypothetical protein